jgi:hypothetical protein
LDDEITRTITGGWRIVRWVPTAAALALSTVPALAQMLSPPSWTPASSAGELSHGNPSFQRTSDIAVLSAAPTSFETRYFGNASADCGANCDGRTEILKSDYTVSWTATAPNLYVLEIDTRRTAGLTIRDEGADGAQAKMGALSCTPSGGTLVSGSCMLSDPADNFSDATSDVAVNQINSLVVCGQSLGVPQDHSVNFMWSQTAVSPSTGLTGNGDEAAVRLGASNQDGSNGAADYPGTNSRRQSNDGHFVTVTITSLCGNGMIDSCGTQSEQCDDGAANGTAGSCCTASCTFANGAACSDGVFCNGADTCQDGTCSVHLGDPCAGGSECNNACDERGQTCRVAAGVPCTDDGNSCTDDQCDGAGACRHSPHDNQSCPAPGICGNGIVESPAEQCEPDQGECCVSAGRPGECQFRGPTEQCGQETRKCHKQFLCTGRSPMCPTDQSNFADPGGPCLDDADPDCVLSACDGGGTCQAVDRVCMANATVPKRRTKNPVVVVDCFSDQPGACSATLQLEPGTTSGESSLAQSARSREPHSSPVRTPGRACPDQPQITTDLTGRTHARTRVLKGDQAPAPGLTHLTIIRLHLNSFGQKLLHCGELRVIARVTLNRGGKQLRPVTKLLKLLQAHRKNGGGRSARLLGRLGDT